MVTIETILYTCVLYIPIYIHTSIYKYKKIIIKKIQKLILKISRCDLLSDFVANICIKFETIDPSFIESCTNTTSVVKIQVLDKISKFEIHY